MYGRKPGNTSRLDALIQGVRDVRRAVGYLCSLPEQFDRQRLIYGGFSFGASHGPIFCVAENRIAAAVLINGGYQGWGRPDRHPEADPYNFTGRLRIPVLMINGRFDPIFPVRETQEPFFEDLGTPEKDKDLIHFDGGHGIPSKDAVAKMDEWLKSKLPPRE